MRILFIYQLHFKAAMFMILLSMISNDVIMYHFSLGDENPLMELNDPFDGETESEKEEKKDESKDEKLSNEIDKYPAINSKKLSSHLFLGNLYRLFHSEIYTPPPEDT